MGEPRPQGRWVAFNERVILRDYGNLHPPPLRAGFARKGHTQGVRAPLRTDRESRDIISFTIHPVPTWPNP